VLLKLDEFDPLPLKTVDGNVFYARAGKAVGRGKITPVRPGSAGQMHEVAGIASASRSWAYAMTAAEKASWATAIGCGLVGEDVFWWLWSLLWGTSSPLSGLTSSGSEIDDAAITSASIDPSAGSFLVQVDSAIAAGSAVVVLRASRPAPEGRVPSGRDLRYIGTIAVGVETDVYAEYFSRFGASGVPGSGVLVEARVADPVLAESGCVVTTLVEVTGGTDVFWIAPQAFTLAPFGRRESDWWVDVPSLPDFTFYEVSITDPSWSLSGTLPWPIRTLAEIEFEDVTGVPRTDTFTVKASPVDPGGPDLFFDVTGTVA